MARTGIGVNISGAAEQMEIERLQNGRVRLDLEPRFMEQKTQTNLSGGAVTFAAPVTYLDFLNEDTTEATFTVNGIAVKVGPGAGYGPVCMGGTPAAAVQVAGTTKFKLGRYE